MPDLHLRQPRLQTTDDAMSEKSKQARPIALANWLMVVAVMVVVMVAVGGITRLTESGLSITQWKPITGAIPPLSDSAWQAEFELYKATGEYRNVTGPAGMDLAAFKFIFFKYRWCKRSKTLSIFYF